jgi:hypothetical protein
MAKPGNLDLIDRCLGRCKRARFANNLMDEMLVLVLLEKFNFLGY